MLWRGPVDDITGRTRPGSHSPSIAASKAAVRRRPMNSGVPSQHQTPTHPGVSQQHEPPPGDSLAVRRRSPWKTGWRTSRVGLILLGSLFTLIFASSALGATTVGLGKAASFSV